MWPIQGIVASKPAFLFLTKNSCFFLDHIGISKLKYYQVKLLSNILVLLYSLQSSLLDLKEHASTLASSGLKKDSRLKSLEIALEQRKEECLKLENQMRKVRKFWILPHHASQSHFFEPITALCTPLLLNQLQS